MERSGGTACSELLKPTGNPFSLIQIYPSLYNGPINYFARLIREPEIVLEQYDHYTKQTFRNRCLIMGPNGILTLSIPVKKQRGKKNYMRDIRIDYDTPWNKIHWRSLVASYATSPFFDYVKDDLVEFYEKKTTFLVDLNQNLLDRILQSLAYSIPISFSEDFTDIKEKSDPRQFIHPKKNQAVEDPDFVPCEYHQVFSDRLGFQSNLSILDLLFNEGPGAPGLLRKSLRTSPLQ